VKPVVGCYQKSKSQHNKEKADSDLGMMLPVSVKIMVYMSHDVKYFIRIKNNPGKSRELGKIGE
jgi:hypothetical protein